VFGIFKKKEPPKEPPIQFPPVPDWKPTIKQPIEKIVECLKSYTEGTKELAIFQHGTCVVLEDGMSNEQAEAFAKEVLHKIFNAHPDMNPMTMKDGNVLVRYNHPAVNLVLSEISEKHWPEINKNHQAALATSEVLMTPLGSNVFDEFGQKALFGRCFMFMDAQDPKIVRIERKAI
jgi:hypothetical protein